MFNYLKTFTDWFRNTNNENLSVIEYGVTHTLTPKVFFETKNFTEVYSDAIFSDNVLYKEYICINKSGIYVYLSRPNYEVNTFEIKVLYKPAQHSEVVLFLRQLKKIKK